MLSGKTAVITGAAKGIGRAIAERFAAEGCNIVLNYRSNIDDEVIEKIKSFGVECLPFKDVYKRQNKYIEHINVFGCVFMYVDTPKV